MEAFEQFVALAMEDEGLVVSGALKFPVRRQTRKARYAEYQTHGFEIDLTGASRDRLVLATVKSYFGSRGVAAADVQGLTAVAGRYAMLNDPVIRDTLVAGAAERFGYREDQVEMRLYVGKFAGGTNERGVREWCSSQHVGGGVITVIGAEQVVQQVRHVARASQYRDSAVLATLKVLDHVNALAEV